MKHFSLQRLCLACVAVVLSLGIWAVPALAYDAPELLPANSTPVVDLAKALTRVQAEKLAQDLADFEAESGWKLRVLTQFDRTPGLAVRDFWDLDRRSVLLVADSRGGEYS